jgi:hypothetical protein
VILSSSAVASRARGEAATTCSLIEISTGCAQIPQFDLPVARGAEAVGVLREELCADGENPTENDFNFFSLNNVASYV